MTNDERATNVVDDIDRESGLDISPYFSVWLHRKILKVLDAAVAEERERALGHLERIGGCGDHCSNTCKFCWLASEIRAGHENPQESAAGRIGNTVIDFESEGTYLDELNKRSENPQGPEREK